MTQYAESPVIEAEAEIIHALTRAGLSLLHADEYELWELAAALGVHRVETRAQHDTRVIVETKQEYWEETQDTRAQKLAGYSARRRERELERKRAKKGEESSA